MSQHQTPSPSSSTARPSDPAAADPALQGEGNYTAARRHRESVKKFVGAGHVEEAARDAAPQTPQEADELKAAEAEGGSNALR